MYLKEIWLDVLDSSGSGWGPIVGFCEHGNQPSGPIQYCTFLGYLNRIANNSWIRADLQELRSLSGYAFRNPMKMTLRCYQETLQRTSVWWKLVFLRQWTEFSSFRRVFSGKEWVGSGLIDYRVLRERYTVCRCITTDPRYANRRQVDLIAKLSSFRGRQRVVLQSIETVQTSKLFLLNGI
jgi:hypothetical protein